MCACIKSFVLFAHCFMFMGFSRQLTGMGSGIHVCALTLSVVAAHVAACCNVHVLACVRPWLTGMGAIEHIRDVKVASMRVF